MISVFIRDARALVTDYNWAPRGMVELGKLAEKKGMKVLSLSKVYAVLFGKRISKGQRITDWERRTLTEPQVSYAGLDAWAGHRIYSALKCAYSPDMKQENFSPLPRQRKRSMRYGKNWSNRRGGVRKVKNIFKEQGKRPTPSDQTNEDHH